MPEIVNRLPNNLRVLRQVCGLTQKEVGKAVGVTGETVGNWETGATEPNISQVMRLAAFLGVDVDRLTSAHLKAEATSAADAT